MQVQMGAERTLMWKPIHFPKRITTGREVDVLASQLRGGACLGENGNLRRQGPGLQVPLATTTPTRTVLRNQMGKASLRGRIPDITEVSFPLCNGLRLTLLGATQKSPRSGNQNNPTEKDRRIWREEFQHHRIRQREVLQEEIHSGKGGEPVMTMRGHSQSPNGILPGPRNLGAMTVGGHLLDRVKP